MIFELCMGLISLGSSIVTINLLWNGKAVHRWTFPGALITIACAVFVSVVAAHKGHEWTLSVWVTVALLNVWIADMSRRVRR